MRAISAKTDFWLVFNHRPSKRAKKKNEWGIESIKFQVVFSIIISFNLLFQLAQLDYFASSLQRNYLDDISECRDKY